MVQEKLLKDDESVKKMLRTTVMKIKRFNLGEVYKNKILDVLNFLSLFFSRLFQRRKSTFGKSYHKGLHAENWVRWILILKGYCILAHRFRTPAGEIDLIARKKGLLLLVEVKARPSLGEGIEALRYRQRARLLRAAAFVAASFPKGATGVVRFDLVIKRPWRFPYFFKNALSEFS